MAPALVLFQDPPHLTGILLGALGALLAAGIGWLFKVYLPARDKRAADRATAELEQDNKRLEAQLEERRDSREYRQTVESDAVSRSLNINDKLVSALISAVDGYRQAYKELEASINKRLSEMEASLLFRYQEIDKRLGPLPRLISDARTQIEMANRERVRMAEILEDVDIELHETKATLKAILEQIR